jgi:hypothetical protein
LFKKSQTVTSQLFIPIVSSSNQGQQRNHRASQDRSPCKSYHQICSRHHAGHNLRGHHCLEGFLLTSTYLSIKRVFLPHFAITIIP